MIGLPSPNANAKPTNQNAIEPEKNKKLLRCFVKKRKKKVTIAEIQSTSW